MMNNNGRPLSRKQTVRVMVALTILVWATETLLKQWGIGAVLPTTQPNQVEPAVTNEPVERFLPADATHKVGATLELRSSATVVGAEVKLRQICRWADRDRALFEPIGDLVLARLAPRAPFKALSIQEVRGILRDAGVNTAAINFAGSISCTVSRSDVEYDEKTALDQWISAREGAEPKAEADPVAIKPEPIAKPATNPAPAAQSPILTLRDALVNDLAARLSLPVETLQIDFKVQDEKVLNISQPLFQFQIEPLRAKSLGKVAWNVMIIGGTESAKKTVTIAAEAKAWQNQVVVARPMAFKQAIRQEDVINRRALVDAMTIDPLLTMEQVVGQQAARELKPGMVMTAKMIDPVQLVKTQQFVTVSLDQGTVRVTSVARALENGTFGQTIRVKNEATREIYQVVVTGPQAATMNLSSPVQTAGSRD